MKQKTRASTGLELGWRNKRWYWLATGKTAICLEELEEGIGTPHGSDRSVRAKVGELGPITVIRVHQLGTDPPEAVTYFHSDHGMIKVTGFSVGRSAGLLRNLLKNLDFRLTQRDEERLCEDGSRICSDAISSSPSDAHSAHSCRHTSASDTETDGGESASRLPGTF